MFYSGHTGQPFFGVDQDANQTLAENAKILLERQR